MTTGVGSSTQRLGRSRAAAASPIPKGSTIVEHFERHAADLAGRPALRWRVGGAWNTMTWDEYGIAVRDVAAALVGLGIEPGDRVAILSGNRWEWHVADLGILSARGVSVPIYPTNSSSQVAYQLGDSGARICFVEGTDQLAKILLRRHELPALEHVVAFERVDGLDDSFMVFFHSLGQLAKEQLAARPGLVGELSGQIAEADLATLVYTSGTTGPPKGVMITHGNIIANIANVTAVLPIGPEDRFLSFLPLSHIAERTVSDFGQVVSGGQTWFATSLASVPADLTACRPTVFFAVPRVWEKFHEAIVERAEHQPLPVRHLFQRYLRGGAARVEALDAGTRRTVAARLWWQALDRTIGARLRSELGLDQARFLVSGAAPIHPDLLRWFLSIGLPIAEVYGQTETTGVTTLNRPGAIRIGSVGPPVPGVDVRLADDDEILVRGDNVAAGYFRGELRPAPMTDADGWLPSGDLGHFGRDGALEITGRKKDLIINAAGKNISPEEIETRLRYEPLISQAVVIGDRRPYLVALLTLDADVVAAWATEHGRSADLESLVDDPELVDAVADEVAEVNARHARVEQIKKWKILPHDFTIAEGELTPTLKVKRPAVESRYADQIEELYAQ